MATQLATQQPRTLDEAVGQLTTQLSNRAMEFKAALPSHITPEKFQRTILTAVASDPDLLKADRRSLLNSCMKAAQDGLMPDKREAALVVFVTRKKDGNQWISVKEVQYMPMVYGLRKKILQSGAIKSITTNVVYRRELEGGYFHYEEGFERTLRHKPMLDLTDEDCTDDNIVAAYSVAVLNDGTQDYDVMRRSEINKVRQMSQTGAIGKTKYNSNEVIQPKGPWVDWFAEMAKKTVMRRHSKTLPMSGDLIDVEGTEQSIAIRSAQMLMASQDADAPVALPSRNDTFDSGTGEVIENEDVARALDAQGFAAMEGRADDQHGEPVTLESALAEIASAELVADVNSRMAALAEYLSETDVDELRSAAMDRIAQLKAV